MTAAITSRRRRRVIVGRARCIQCGCTDFCACLEGCYWIEVDRVKGVGVCSSCPDARPRFRELVASAGARSAR
jgi:hypothetical protein